MKENEVERAIRTSLFPLSGYAKGERDFLGKLLYVQYTSNSADLYAYRRPFHNPPVLGKRDPPGDFSFAAMYMYLKSRLV